MLKSFFYEEFKSFKQSRLEFEKLTTVIGSNASGKSNAIEGMKILSEISTGRDLSVILDGSKNVDSEIRGGSVGCPRIGSDTFTLGCTVDFDETFDLEYAITIKVSNRVYVMSESLYKTTDQGKTVVFVTKETADEYSDIQVKYSNGHRGKNPEVTCHRSMAILTQLAAKMPATAKKRKENNEYIYLVREQLGKILFLDPLPSQMRDYSRKSDNELRPKADNLSSVLYELCKKEQHKAALLDLLKMLPENEITDIGFIDTTIGDVMLQLNERYGMQSEYIEAKRLSDGTLRYLAIITALISEDSGTMVVIEEVDNGIHPSRIKRLIETVSRLTEERKVDVMITTHNPILLNALTKDELLGVVLCYRHEQDGSSTFFALPDMNSLPILLAKGDLGDLTVRDDLVSSVKNPQQRSHDLDWLGV